ncbi:hypothetical protein PROFUN_01036 [Planoprotostelium fungivorum]|uniref:Uncharacterized protein n=1 Tax=Planoprotostelium fungivorum TaxID=1890364 RepID=A0A2P6N4J6_9EUKA|nr:hypothetical protein PROFUN_01036 [Planoprotostelium fungivorum]
MVHQFSCRCLNVTVHYTNQLGVHPASEVDGQSSRRSLNTARPPPQMNVSSLKFLEEDKHTLWKSFIMVDLALAGIPKTHEFLTETIHLAPVDEQKKTYGGIHWDIVVCRNCSVQLCAIDPVHPNRAILNGAISQKNVEERLKELPNHVYSPIFKIILERDNNAINMPLECPSESQVDAFETFKSLQNQLENVLKDEEKAIERRVEELRKKELENLQKLQTSAFVERKLLWHKLADKMQWNVDIIEEPQSTPSTQEKSKWKSVTVSTTRRDEEKIGLKMSGDATITLKRPTSPTSEDRAAVFEFDEESDDDEEDKRVVDKDGSPILGRLSNMRSSREEETEVQRIPVRRSSPGNQLMGTSVPIGIPKQMKSSFAPRAASQKDHDAIVSRQFTEMGEDELSKSFDIPVSQNRRLIFLH